jgi:hypothetical protein
LRQNLTRLRHVLGPESFADRQNEVTLTAAIETDWELLLAAVESGAFENAVAYYGGPFLADFRVVDSVHFDHWVDGERERFRNCFLRAAGGLIRQFLDRGQPARALAMAQGLHADEPESESVHRLLIEAALAAREVSLAQSEAERLLERLRMVGRPPEAATVRLVRVVSSAVPGSSDSAPAFVPRLAGRSREFEAIVKEWNVASSGRLRRLHVEGQVGLGKTRLLEEAGLRIKALGGRVIHLRAHPWEKQVPLSAGADLAAHLVELPGGKAIPALTAGVLVGINPALSNAFPGAVPPRESQEELLRQRVLALGDLLTATAEESSLALLLDDVQWMDEASCRVLAAALPRLEASRILVLSAGRPGSRGIFLGSEPRRLLLAPLSLGDTAEILSGLGDIAEESGRRRITAAFHRASNGSPMLLMETIQMAIEAGKLVQREAGWLVPEPEEFIQWLGERNAMEARLGSLSTSARKFLLTLAATGVPLARTEVEHAVQSGQVSPDTLSELERRGYIEPKGNRWDIAHHEVGEALARMAGATERQKIHAALGRALIGKGIESQEAAKRAARHLVEGGSRHELLALFRQWVARARAAGDRSPPRALAVELIGEHADATTLDLLIGALPLLERLQDLLRRRQ